MKEHKWIRELVDCARAAVFREIEHNSNLHEEVNPEYIILRYSTYEQIKRELTSG